MNFKKKDRHLYNPSKHKLKVSSLYELKKELSTVWKKWKQDYPLQVST